VEVPGPKQRRKLARSTHSGEAREPRSATERAADRAETRKRKADSRRRARARTAQRRGPERGEGTPPAERVEGARKIRQGTVVSAKPDKTITVRVEITRRHPTYEKVVRRSNTVHAHDERNEAGEGDIVRVVESRPLSRLKRWRLLEIVERAR
jgi:small subunit ribosomal protein S17